MAMKRLLNHKGSISFGNLVLIVLIVGGGYVGAKIAIPKIRASQVKELFKSEVGRVKRAGEGEVRLNIHRKLREMEITLDPDEDFEDGLRIIEEEGEPTVIEATYRVVVKFIGGKTRTYVFHPRAVEGE